MPKFLAITSRGLRDLLREELNELGFAKVRPSGSAVEFQANWEGCHRANLYLRTATRVLYPVLDFPAYQPDTPLHHLTGAMPEMFPVWYRLPVGCQMRQAPPQTL